MATKTLNLGNSSNLVNVIEYGTVGLNGAAATNSILNVKDGLSKFTRGTGAAEISPTTWALMLGTKSARTATANYYYPGIAFNHMTYYNDGDSYFNAPQGWMGLRLHSTPGSELSYLVLATKPGTGTSQTGNDVPIERMCIAPDGKVGIGIKAPEVLLHVAGDAKITGTITGTLSGNAATATALTSSAGSATLPVYFSGGKPAACSYSLGANIKNYSGSLATGGWATMNGKANSPSIAIAYNNSPANWNSATYSATMVWGCSDTRGLLDCAYSTPIVTFGGCSFGGATDDNPTWYMKISGTSGTTYNLNNMPLAATATALTTSAGSTGQPVYFTGGKPSAIDWHIGNAGLGERNANNITYNMIGYYQSNGPTGTNSTDGAIYAQAYSSSWVGQIAQDYRNGKLNVRGKNNGTWTSWLKVWCQGDSVTGAVWNDYAEYRESNITNPGYVLSEVGDDTLVPTEERLQHFAGVSSDTWGFAEGETETAKTPIAVAGRVLVYTYKDRNNYKPGDCVCAAPGGTVDIMTREEIIQYPDRIVGTVSCVPDYEEWGSGDRPAVKVNGRIWIKVR